MLNLFKNFIKKKNLFSKKSNILIAISGGVDSMVLANFFYESKINFTIAHCNFKLRGYNSDKDEYLVKNISEKYKVNFYKKNFNINKYSKLNKISIQMAARELRYKWFNDILLKKKFNKIATAHHLNDRIETILFNITKGTGISGLHGVLLKNKKIIRPILFLKKNQIILYAKKKKLQWNEDSSNSINNYKRNLIRNKVIPILKLINPQIENTFQNNIKKFIDTENIFKYYIKKIEKKIITIKNLTYYININKINNKDWNCTILLEILKKFEFNSYQVKNLIDNSKNGKLIFSNSHVLSINKKKWIIRMIENKNKKIYFLNIKNKFLTLNNNIYFFLIFKKKKFNKLSNPNISVLNFSLLKFPLKIRKWQIGDFFYPLGMLKRKKINHFLINQKISIIEKEDIYIAISKEKIICILEYRIDERFKIKKKTNIIYQIKKQ